MDLASLLESPSARAKEAEALAILAAHAAPARRMLDQAKREFGQVLPTSHLGMFISPTAEEAYRKGKRDATRLLFDGYAEIVFPRVSDADAFIDALNEIGMRVKNKLGVVDGDEAELCKLEWEKKAWERAQPTAIGRAWRSLQLRVRTSRTNREVPGLAARNEPPNHEKAVERAPAGWDGAPVLNAQRPANGDQHELISETPIDAQPPPRSVDTGSPDAEIIAERVRRRNAVVMPILKTKRWKRGRLVTEAGVGKATVYGYLDGTRAWIGEDNRKAIAEVLGLTPEDLPD
jgi:hypothetical protein